MKSKTLRNPLWLQLIVGFVAVCLVVLPLVPVVSMATDSASVFTPAEEAAAPKAVVLSGDDKAAVTQAENPDSINDAPKEHSPVVSELNRNSADKSTAATRKIAVPAEPAEEADEGMSTLAKVGIGVGAAAVIGVGVAMLAGGGSEDSGPVLPTSEQLIGRWTARGTSHVDNRTYTGVYDLYTIGSHTYDIYITGDNVRKQGRGAWALGAGTNSLRLENDAGSVYIGDFQNEDFTIITLQTTNGRWEVVLTKQ